MAVAFKLPLFTPHDDIEQIDSVETTRQRPSLVLLPSVRPSRIGLAVLCLAVVASLLGVVMLRTHMAEQQMKIDSLNRDISRARAHFETLRAERASLQSPTHLMGLAQQLGLTPGVGVRVVEIPADIAAEVAANVGKIDQDVAASVTSPLDEFGRLKTAVVGG